MRDSSSRASAVAGKSSSQTASSPSRRSPSIHCSGTEKLPPPSGYFAAKPQPRKTVTGGEKKSQFVQASPQWTCGVFQRHLTPLMFLRKLAALSAPVAQLDRASDYGSEGLKFESSRVRHIFSRICFRRCKEIALARISLVWPTKQSNRNPARAAAAAEKKRVTAPRWPVGAGKHFRLASIVERRITSIRIGAGSRAGSAR